MRSSSVSELTRNSENDPHTEEKESPPMRNGGPSQKQRGGADSADDFASAFCRVLQARYRVKEVIRVAAEIEASKAVRERLRPDERGENLAVYREAFEVLLGVWAWPVRRHFEQLMGHPLEEFEHAVELLGEELWGSAAAPGPIVSMITPRCFENE